MLSSEHDGTIHQPSGWRCAMQAMGQDYAFRKTIFTFTELLLFFTDPYASDTLTTQKMRGLLTLVPAWRRELFY
jgi:hypothetical protein